MSYSLVRKTYLCTYTWTHTVPVNSLSEHNFDALLVQCTSSQMSMLFCFFFSQQRAFFLILLHTWHCKYGNYISNVFRGQLVTYRCHASSKLNQHLGFWFCTCLYLERLCSPDIENCDVLFIQRWKMIQIT